MRLVLVEDSREVRNRLIALLQSCPEIVIAGVAATESDAIQLIEQAHPDTILLDINLAMGNGVRVLESIRRRGNDAYVIMMTALSHEAYRDLCLRLGANEFRDKAQDFNAMLESIRERAERQAAHQLKTRTGPADIPCAIPESNAIRNGSVQRVAGSANHDDEKECAAEIHQPEHLQ